MMRTLCLVVLVLSVVVCGCESKAPPPSNAASGSRMPGGDPMGGGKTAPTD